MPQPGEVVALSQYLDGENQPPRVGLEFYYPNGRVMARFGQLPDGTGRVGMEICDENGVVKVIAGEIADGQYGLAARDPDTGEVVDLAQLAFGMKADDQGSVITVNDTSVGGIPQWVAAPDGQGPRVTDVRIGSSKKAAVFFGCQMIWGSAPNSNNNRVAKMSFRIINQADGQVTFNASDTRSLTWDTDGDASFFASNSSFALVPQYAFPVVNGLYTFEAMYQVSAFNSENMSFQNRSLLVNPF
ncbi:hypothetical protein ML5_0878 [Micromonospora sp. L5]|uniref:hypothetical protein n=1 Tax=Micromonospora sp. (strain L5) TaxID=648999 RepID=UPI0001C45C9E|nr:hypothetical protein [Micromonospora sp. L5]ADU06420.1 hypothetical protein ML5_0878 [Micromonospora sp. L5]